MKLLIFDFDGVLVDTIPNFLEGYRTKTRELKIPLEIKSALLGFSEAYTLAVVSSTLQELIKEILSREGVSECFGEILGSEMHISKVVKIQTLLAKHQVPPEEAVYITDTVGDVMEARECGVRSIAVTWGFHDEERLQKANPERIVRTPAELIKAVAEI